MTITLYNHEVTSSTKQAIYASRLQASLAKFARAVTLRPVSLSIKSDDFTPSPAWSTDTGIVLMHRPQLGNISSAANIIRLKGLAVHEIAHLMYTPRDRTHFMKWVADYNHLTAFNILEDNRIENIMVANMSGIKPWLIHTVTGELLNNLTPAEQANLLPLVWGRKYLPADVRKAAYNTWSSTAADAAEVADILDKYIVLNFHNKEDIATAKPLIGRLHSIMNVSSNMPSSPNHVKDSTSAPSSQGETYTASKREIDKALKEVSEAVASDSAHEDTDTDTTEDAPPAVSGGDSGEPNANIASALRSAKASAESDVLEDVKNTIESIRDADSKTLFNEDDNIPANRRGVPRIPKYQLKYENASVDAVNNSRRFAKELQEVRAMFDPGWVRKSSQGRLNVRDYMLGTDLDEAFDLWDQGNQDVTDIECVILLDNSGSMRDMCTAAYESMWATKRALDSIGADTTVIQFGSWGEILYPSEVKATTRMLTARFNGGGSTNPLASLVKAKDILSNSSRAIKILIVITDGDWGNKIACDQVIASMRSSNVLTGLVYLEDANLHEVFKHYDDNKNRMFDAHYCEMFTHLTNPSDIVDFAKQLAKVSRERMLHV